MIYKLLYLIRVFSVPEKDDGREGDETGRFGVFEINH